MCAFGPQVPGDELATLLAEQRDHSLCCAFSFTPEPSPPRLSFSMERPLATVQRILNVHPIPGADAIDVASVRGWKVVIKKGEYQPATSPCTARSTASAHRRRVQFSEELVSPAPDGRRASGFARSSSASRSRRGFFCRSTRSRTASVTSARRAGRNGRARHHQVRTADAAPARRRRARHVADLSPADG